MNDNEIRDVVAEKAGVSTDVVDRVLVAFQSTVLLGLRQNEDIVLSNFGVFNRPMSNEPQFVFTVDVGEPVPETPIHLIQDLSNCHEQRAALSTFLREHDTRQDVFGHTDRYPGLDPAFKPETVTPDEVKDEARREPTRISTQLIAMRVVENLKASLG